MVRRFALLLTALFGVLIPSVGRAAVQTQVRFAGTAIPTGNWANPQAARVIDDVCALGDGGSTRDMTLRDFGFVLPPGAVVQRIQVRSRSHLNTVSTQDRISLLGGSDGATWRVIDLFPLGHPDYARSTDHRFGPCGWLEVLWGDPTDPDPLWGETTWTAEEINAAGFGVFYDNDFTNTSIDGVEVSITFDGGPAVTIDQAATQSDPVSAGPIVFDVVFAFPVIGFTAADVDLSQSTLAGTSVASVTGSGTSYSVSVNTPASGVGEVIARIPAGAATSGGLGNAASTSTDNRVVFDTVAPTAVVSRRASQASPTRFSPVEFSVVFSEPVTGFAADDVIVSGTAAGKAVVGVSPLVGPAVTWIVEVSATGSGTITLNVGAGAAFDRVNLGNSAATPSDNTITYDIVAPTVTIEQSVGQADLTNVSPMSFTVVFSEAVTGFGPSDITVGGTAAGRAVQSVSPPSGASFTFTVLVSATGSGTVIPQINAGAASDAAGNGSGASTSLDNEVTYDNSTPTVTITQAATQADPTNLSPISFTVVFSEPVVGFESPDVDLTQSSNPGALIAAVSGPGPTYTVEVTGMNGVGNVIGRIPVNVAHDAAGNGNAASGAGDNSVLFDDGSRSTTIEQAVAQADPTNATTIHFTVIFSEDVTGFTVGDVTLTGTAPGKVAVSVTPLGASASQYDVAVTVTGSGTVMATVPAGAATGVSTNPTVASISTDNLVDVDVVKPTVTVNRSSSDSTTTMPVWFDVVFSEVVTTFDSGDLSFAGSSAGGSYAAAITGSGTTYSVAVTGLTTPGALTVSIPADAVTDPAGNGNFASTHTDNSVSWEGENPTVTISRAPGQADPARTQPVLFTVAFSEPVTGLTRFDFVVSPFTPDVSVSGGPTVYTLDLRGFGGEVTLTVTLPANVVVNSIGKGNLSSTGTDNSVRYDGIPPTVTVAQAASQTDPTSVSPVRFTATFSEAVTDFTSSDVSLAGGSLSGSVSVTGTGPAYAINVSDVNGAGNLVATIIPGAATDPAGNPSAAPVILDNVVVFDNVRPTVTVEQAAAQEDPANTSTIHFTVQFDEPVGNFTAASVSFAGSTAAGPLLAAVTGTGALYDVEVSGMSGNGDVVVSVADGAVSDPVGNSNVASTSVDNRVLFDDTAPTVTVGQAPSQADPARVGPIQFTVVFSENVSGFDADDLSFAGTTADGTLVAIVTGSGTTYDVSVSGMSGIGDVVVSVVAGAAVDSAGNSSEASTGGDNVVLFDAVPPTVTVDEAATQADPTNASPIHFAVVFSEPVAGFGGGDVLLSGSVSGTLAATVTGSGTTYDVAVTGMTGTGTVVAWVAADAAADPAGNNSAASTSADDSVTYDDVRPTVTVEQAASQADPERMSSIHFSVQFSEPVVGFNATSVSFDGSTATGTLTATVTGSGPLYDVAVSGMSAGGNVQIRVDEGAVTDPAGNSNTASTSSDNQVLFDNTAPTVTIEQEATQADPTNGTPIRFTVVFNETVTGFTAADITFTGSTTAGTLVGVVTGSGTTYEVSVTGMSGSGNVVAGIAQDAATDAAGNNSIASTSIDNTVLYDGIAPTVTIEQASAQTDPTNGSPLHFTVTFSEPVTGFANADVSLSGTVSGTLTVDVTGSGTTYDVAVTGMSGHGTVVASVNAGAAVDVAGNASALSTSTDDSVTFDDVPPTVTIEQHALQADPANTAPIRFAVIFTEAVSGLTGSDVSFDGSTAPGTLTATITGSGAAYGIEVAGMTGNGSVVVTLPAGAVLDAAGNASLASSSSDNSVLYDGVAPTVTVQQTAGQPDPTRDTPILFTVLFSEPVTGFAADDVSFAGSTALGTLVANATGSGTTYELRVSGVSGTGNVVSSIVAGAALDAAGNASLGSTSSDNVVLFDSVAPTVTIERAAAQADPTKVSPVHFTVTFSEPVTGFASDDLAWSGTVSGTLVANTTGSGTTYDVAVSGMSGTGTVVASIAAGAAIDVVGNGNVASTSVQNSVTFDEVPPQVTIDQAAAQLDPATTSPLRFRVAFTEPVIGFTGADLSFAGSSSAGTLTATATGSGALYEVEVSGMTGEGSVIVSVPAAAAGDAAGNDNTASTSSDNSVQFDFSAPTVTLEQALSQLDPTNSAQILFTVTFSEPVSGLTGSDVTLSGTAGGATASVTGSGAAYDVAISGMSSSGTVVPSIAAGAAFDMAGNPSAASTSNDHSVTFDDAAPEVTIDQHAAQADPINVGPLHFTVVFDATVTGFTSSDVSLAGSTASGVLVAAVTGSGATYDVDVSGMTGSGDVIVNVPAGAATDASGNPSNASTSTDNGVTFDTTAPTVTIDEAPATPGSAVNFVVVFSEDVTDFADSTIDLSGSTIGGSLHAVVTGSGTTYNVSVRGMVGSGMVIAKIQAGAAIDGAGNLSEAATSTDNAILVGAGADIPTLDPRTLALLVLALTLVALAALRTPY